MFETVLTSNFPNFHVKHSEIEEIGNLILVLDAAPDNFFSFDDILSIELSFKEMVSDVPQRQRLHFRILRGDEK